MVEVVQKGVERPHPLFNSARQSPPFASRDNTRHHIKGDQAFFGLILAIDIKGDTSAAEALVRLTVFALKGAGLLLIIPLAIVVVGGTCVAQGRVHFVEILGWITHRFARSPYACNSTLPHCTKKESFTRGPVPRGWPRLPLAQR